MRRLSLYLLFVFVFSVPWQNAIQIGGSRTLTSFIGIAAIAVALVTCLLEGRMAKPSSFLFAFGALVFWQLATYFWSGDPTSTLIRVATMVQMLMMIWLIAELSATEHERLQLVQAFVIGCMVACGAVIYAYFAGESVAGYRFTPSGFDPNELATVIAAGIPMALLVATSTGRGLLRWAHVLYVPLGLFAVILTASRTGFVATCIGLCSLPFALYAVKPLHRVIWSAAILVAFVGAFYLMPTSLNENLQRVTFSGDTESISTLTTRTTIWSAGLEAFREHPAVGVGFGTYGAIAQTRMGVAKASHNLWIQTAAETGVVGLALLIAALTAAVVPALGRPGRRMSFHVILFLVLMTTSLALDVIANKSLWIALAFLSATGPVQIVGNRIRANLSPQLDPRPPVRELRTEA